MNNESWLVQLLEHVTEKDESKQNVVVYDTLLELYLQDDVSANHSFPCLFVFFLLYLFFFYTHTGFIRC